MATYFGTTTPTAAFFAPGVNQVFGNGTEVYTCPGTGNQTLTSLGYYAKSNGGTPGNIRIVIRDLSLNLIAQGSAVISVNSTTGQWWEHTSFVDASGAPITPVLVGGTSYKIRVWESSTDVLGNYDFVADGVSASTSADYSAGFPDPGVSLSPSTVRYRMRAGVVAASATLEVGSGQTYSTIGAAITAASANDTINIHAGTYTEDVTVSKSLTIQANSGDSPEIVGTVTITQGIDGVTLDGLIVRDGTGDGIYMRQSNRITVQNCTVYGHSGSGIVVISGHSSDASYANGVVLDGNGVHDNGVDGVEIHGQYITVSDNSIYDNIDTSWATTHPDGIQILGSTVDTYSSCQHVKIERNIIRNHTQGIFLEGTAADESSDCEDILIDGNLIETQQTTVNGVDMTAIASVAIMCKWSKTVRIYNNTVGNSGASGRGVHVQGCANGTIYIENNILNNDVGSSSLYVEDTSDIGALDYNLYYGPSATHLISWGVLNYDTVAAFNTATTYEGNGVASDPEVNYATGVYSGAGPYDAGADLSAYVGTDIMGTTRPVGGVFDIGAYEKTATTYTVTYDGNTNDSGTAPTDASSPYNSGELVTALDNTGSLAKTGYTFAGWNTAANGSGTAYAADDTFSMPASNVTLYAQWTPAGVDNYDPLSPVAIEADPIAMIMGGF